MENTSVISCRVKRGGSNGYELDNLQQSENTAITHGDFSVL